MKAIHTRRHFITVVGAAAVGTAGCMFDSNGTDDNSSDSSTDSESWEDGTGFQEAERECVSKGPARAEGAPIDITETESDTEFWCEKTAGTAALEKVGDRLDFDDITDHSDFGISYDTDFEKTYIHISTNYPYEECPPLPFEDVVTAAPSEVTVTFSRENTEPYTCAEPIYIEQWNYGED